MVDFPFVIGNKVVTIRAPGVNNAIDRVLTKHPNKFIKTKHAYNMDLISAKAAAAKESKVQKKPIYVLIDADGESDISSAPLRGVAHKFVGGIEDKNFAPHVTDKATEQPAKNKSIPAQSEKAKKIISKNQIEETMTTVKKAPKKVAAKKAAPKKVSAPKKAANKADWGKAASISIKDMRAGIKKGIVYRDPQGVIQTEKYLATRAKQDYIREGMFAGK